MTLNHITVKVPDEDGSFLINPYVMHFTEVTACLIKIDVVVMGHSLPEASSIFGTPARLRDPARDVEHGQACHRPGRRDRGPPPRSASGRDPGRPGRAEFNAMVRRIDKIDTSWRD